MDELLRPVIFSQSKIDIIQLRNEEDKKEGMSNNEAEKHREQQNAKDAETKKKEAENETSIGGGVLNWLVLQPV